VFLAVDKSTGAPAADATQAINEAFISGTQPGAEPAAQTVAAPSPEVPAPVVPPAEPTPATPPRQR
jgi:hypothetical protein